jgi:hypothetical protein
MAERPTIKLIDNPIAVGDARPGAAVEPPAQSSPRAKSRASARGPRPEPRRPVERTAPDDSAGDTNPYAGMRKVQAPVRLFPPLWEQLEQLVRELRDEGLEVDKTALLNAVLHFHGPGDADVARALVNRWRALLARPPAPRR